VSDQRHASAALPTLGKDRRYVGDRVGHGVGLDVLDRFFSQNFGFPLSVSIDECSVLIHVHVTVTRRTNGQSLGTFEKVMFFFFLLEFREACCFVWVRDLVSHTEGGT
jgi:hypothetical protein